MQEGGNEKDVASLLTISSACCNTKKDGVDKLTPNSFCPPILHETAMVPSKREGVCEELMLISPLHQMGNLQSTGVTLIVFGLFIAIFSALFTFSAKTSKNARSAAGLLLFLGILLFIVGLILRFAPL